MVRGTALAVLGLGPPCPAAACLDLLGLDAWSLNPSPHATLTGGDCQGPAPWPGDAGISPGQAPCRESCGRARARFPEHPGASALGTPAAPHPAPPAQCCLRPRVHPAPQPPRRVLLRHWPLSPSRSGAQEPSCLRAGEPRLRPGSLGPRPVPATTGASPPRPDSRALGTCPPGGERTLTKAGAPPAPETRWPLLGPHGPAPHLEGCTLLLQGPPGQPLLD